MSDCFDHEADALDDLCFGRTYDEGHGERFPTSKTCKFCGMGNLYWHQKEGKWKLCINGKPHDCKPVNLTTMVRERSKT